MLDLLISFVGGVMGGGIMTLIFYNRYRAHADALFKAELGIELYQDISGLYKETKKLDIAVAVLKLDVADLMTRGVR